VSLDKDLESGTSVVVVDRDGLDGLLEALSELGYRTLGPTVRDGSICFAPVDSVADLPEGWHDSQSPGSYLLEHAGDRELFGWAVGQESIKTDVFPPSKVVWRARTTDGSVRFEQVDHVAVPTALFGARPCEVAALEVLDKVLGPGAAGDPCFSSRRARFVVVAECSAPSGTCFCSSMGTGPSATGSFDLALTELQDENGQRFLVRVGSSQGAALVSRVASRDADESDHAARERALERARANMGRKLETEGLAELLRSNLDHQRWDEVADRCLACGNCTLVCPTCFCADVHDSTDISGTVERRRSWASCFDLAHSYLHGGAVRESKRSRYRQWMTHKLSTWWDQFGTSGCVGCGRCITWCPVGIDITEEAAAIRGTETSR
jgi:sulfhydrogenase subunit beta (sulfur reductase)